jgi:hypothetical protein
VHLHLPQIIFQPDNIHIILECLAKLWTELGLFSCITSYIVTCMCELSSYIKHNSVVCQITRVMAFKLLA